MEAKEGPLLERRYVGQYDGVEGQEGMASTG